MRTSSRRPTRPAWRWCSPAYGTSGTDPHEKFGRPGRVVMKVGAAPEQQRAWHKRSEAVGGISETCSVCGSGFEVQFRYQMEERDGGFSFFCSQKCLEKSQVGGQD